MSSFKATKSKASIVTHRWFPKAIGVWCAALFGLCSLAVGSDVLERVVTLLGIDRLVPAAAPPLGQTARLLLAMGMAGVGEIAGLMLGGWLAARSRRRKMPQRLVEPGEREASDRIAMPPVRARDRHADAPPRRPLSAVDDLGDDGKAGREPRAVAGLASLPADNCSPAEGAERETRTETTVEGPQSALSAALDLAICDALPEEQVLLASALNSDPDEAVPTSALSIEPAPAPVSIVSAPLETLGAVQLSERLALALEARRERQAQRLAATLAPEGEASETASNGYSSLLAVGSTPRRPGPLRIDEPHSGVVQPVVTFPGRDDKAPQADPEETGRALRAALASLQRISGAR